MIELHQNNHIILDLKTCILFLLVVEKLAYLVM